MSKTSTNTKPEASISSAVKPAVASNSTVKPTVARPTSNTNINMEYRGGVPSFTKKGK